MYTILITGGCGFVGSNLAILLKSKYPTYNIICLDNLKRRGSELNLRRLFDQEIKFIHADIRIKEDLQIQEHIDFIIDAAAEPSVLAGTQTGIDYLINTNLTGTINTLHLAVKNNAKLIFLSTSRVYAVNSLQQINYTESDTRFEISKIQSLQGVCNHGVNELFPVNQSRSLYGATKLASELLIQEFEAFFGLKYVVNRCGVIAGPHQMGKVDQGVVALWLARHYWKKPVTYIGFGGKGKQLRDVLHINDLFDLIDHQLHNFQVVKSQTFNAGGGTDCCISLKELTDLCRLVSGNKVGETCILENRKADIPLYVTDNGRLSGVTGWRPVRKMQDVVADTFSWLNENESQLTQIFNS